MKTRNIHDKNRFLVIVVVELFETIQNGLTLIFNELLPHLPTETRCDQGRVYCGGPKRVHSC